MPIIKPSTAFKQSADWVSAEVRAYMKDQVSTHVDTVQDVRDNDFEKSRFIFVKSLAATFRLDLSSGADDDGVNVLHDNIGRRYLKVIGTGLGGVDFDAQVADLAGRAAYDDEAEGFKVLVSDVGDGRAAIYSKDSGASADWSDPAYVTGPQGSTGDIGGVAFQFDDGTADANPGAGNIRANNADLSAATTLFVSKTNRYGDDLSAFLASLDDSTSSHKGYLILTAPDSETQATFSITGLTDASGYVKLTVSQHSGATSFVDAERLAFQFSRTGNAGDLNGVTPGTTGLELLEAETEGDAQTAIGLLAGAAGKDVLAKGTAEEIVSYLGLTGNQIPSAPYFESNGGGQLKALKEALNSPFHQKVGIVLIGDSITWGRTLPDNAETEPRDGTLSDPRDDFTSSSWANTVKRYIGERYARGATPTLSNWAASSSGEAIATYEFDDLLYPKFSPFIYSSSGSSLSETEVEAAASPTGFQWQLADGNVAGTSYHQIEMPNFTGDTFTLIFASVGGGLDLSYELFVDGISQGVFSTAPDGGSIVVGNGNRRTHTFTYIRDKTVMIRSNRDGAGGNLRLRLNGVEVPRQIKITNQGINGSSARAYKVYNLSGSFGDGVAVGDEDDFVFVQLGTNDRGIRTDTPTGTTTFRKNLEETIAILTPLASTIMMCSNITTDENPATKSFTMADVRSVLQQVSASEALDFIDNYTAFDGVTLSEYLADGLHPNAAGHAVMARNIIGAIERS